MMIVSHRFVPGEVNISFTSAEEPWSTRPGSWLRLTASRSKKLILWTEKWEAPSLSLTSTLSDLSGVKPRMLGAGGSSWGSTSWNVQRWPRGFSRWRESTGTRTSGTLPTASWTMTSPWWRPPRTSTPPTSSATPACRASRPASTRDTTAGSRAGGTPGVSGGPRER